MSTPDSFSFALSGPAIQLAMSWRRAPGAPSSAASAKLEVSMLEVSRLAWAGVRGVTRQH
jgi:hypothetical protein